MKIASREIASASVMAALIYVGTSIAIPMPAPLGIWHFGDIITFITGIFFGSVVAIMACGTGAMVFDIWNPLYGSTYIIYAPATIIIRTFMGAILGSLRTVFHGKPRASEVFAMALAVTEKNLGYFLYDYFLWDFPRLPAVALIDLTFFPMDGLFILVTIPLMSVLRRRLGKEYIIPPSKPAPSRVKKPEEGSKP